ncbi:NADPH-dependent FMN reductase [Nakamurella endophytica]|uniref:FMN reductase n=1 Tax=Nakamurella endophytica TaxID=1748367 RepID=A0A917SKB1_9ACTN|nr:NAD(P)H-dependent oxidoreductase [Nakamurella endophytica]GGL85580.1 FMN reductase [Nakamurella endophytica]
MSVLKIVVGSTRPGRIGPHIARWFTDAARRHGGFDTVEVLDLADFDLPLLDEPHHPRLRTYTKPHTLRWSEAVDGADALVFVSPEYNYSLPASLKNAMDFLVQEWAYKPLGLVTYGGASGGMRAAQAIRQVAAVLRMVPVPDAVALPLVFRQLVDGEFVPEQVNEDAARTMLDELAKLAVALAPLRERAAV